MTIYVVLVLGKHREWIEVFDNRITAEEYADEFKGKATVYERIVKSDSKR